MIDHETEFGSVSVRLARILDLGTSRYSQNVARRLRALNLACCATALGWFAFGVVYLPDIRLRPVVVIDFIVAILLLAIPALNAVSPRSGSFIFVAVTYVGTFTVCYMLGTDTGMQIQFLAVAAGAVFVFGTDQAIAATLTSFFALVLIVVLEISAPADSGLLDGASMLGSFVAGVAASVSIVFAVVFYAAREMTRAEATAEFEYGRSDALLKNVLPASIADRLRSKPGQIIADRYETASVLFADMAGFTAEASHTSPDELVIFLNEVFTTFDRLVERHELEKIKTAGDSYMVVSGIPHARPDHAVALVRLGMEMLDAAGHMHDPHGRKVFIRIGIASGPVVAGIVGTKKFFYDVWGDAVNVASRMESLGVAGKVQVSQETYEAVKVRFAFESRGLIDVKGKGKMQTWLLVA
jgi:adenylate cyclase